MQATKQRISWPMNTVSPRFVVLLLSVVHTRETLQGIRVF